MCSLLLPLGPAHALNECGVGVPGGTVTCNNDGVPATDANPYVGGIRYVLPGITLNIDGTTSPINVVRPGGFGIIAVGNGPAPMFLNALGTVDIRAGGIAIGARNTIGPATLNYDDGTILTGAGAFNIGVYVQTDGAGDGTINYNSGVITTSGNNSYSVNVFTFGSGSAIINYESGQINGGPGNFVGGPYARAVGDGDARITYNSGSVTSSGYRGFGAIAQSDGAGDASVIYRSGTVNTSGFQAVGVHAFVAGSGALLIDVGENSDITTTGPFANGILGTVAPATNTESLIINNAGTARTSGFGSHALWGWHGGPGNIIITNTGDLTAAGDDADGIRAEANTTGTFEVNALAGTVISGSGAAAGVHTLGISGGVINIAATAVIDGSTTGVGVLDESGPLTLNTSGTILGNILSQHGADVLKLLGGSLTGFVSAGTGPESDVIRLAGTIVSGEIHADDLGGDLATDGDDRFIWTAGNTAAFRGGAGSDHATVSANEFDGTQILDGGDDRTIADGWIDTVSLSGLKVTADGANIINWETVALTNGSDITFSGSQLRTGSADGVDPISGLRYGLVIGGGSAARFAKSFTIDGNLNNFGVVDLSRDNKPGTVLTVRNNYVSTSRLLIDTNLNDGGPNNTSDAKITDQLIVHGNGIGQTTVEFRNRGGRGASTDRNNNGRIDPSEGILVAQIQGRASANSFVQSAPIYAGAYMYSLTAISPSQSESGFWDYVLASTLVPSVAVYEAMPLTVAALNKMPTLQQRVGNRSWRNANNGGGADSINRRPPIEGGGLWARIIADAEHIDPKTSTSLANYDVRKWKFQAGLDGVLFDNGGYTKIVGGMTIHHGRSSLDANSKFGSGSIKTDGTGIGATLTWCQTSGFYVDTQAQWSRFESDLSSRELGLLAKGKDAFAHALSAETGQRLALSNEFSVTPQAQIVYASTRFESFSDALGTVTLNDAKTLQGRAGVSIDWQQRQFDASDNLILASHFYVITNLRYNFWDHGLVNFSGKILSFEPDRLVGELGLGWSINWNDDQMSFYGQATIATGMRDFGNSYSYGATTGIRTRF